MSVQIRKLSYSIGAEIIGVDISKPIDDENFRDIHAAFLKHGIILVRGQALTREQHIAFGQRFGEVNRNDEGRANTLPEYPEILLVEHRPAPQGQSSNKARKPGYVGDFWHTDRSYVLNPPMASLLRAIEIPDIGGETQFANMSLAYEALSDGMKKLIDRLDAIHPEPTRHRPGDQVRPPVAQPVLRVHPETGKKSLYLTEKVTQFVGMTVEESRPLLQFLLSHATRPQFVYRHKWQKDDLIMWDNRCMLHNAVGDFDKTQVRHMERIMVRGTASGYMLETHQSN